MPLTIPDEVLLRILETSANRSYKGFHPRECRIHCKNYFGNICETYEYMLNKTVTIAVTGVDWRPPIKEMLGDDSHGYLESTRGVAQMLQNTKQLLEENTKRIFPK